MENIIVLLNVYNKGDINIMLIIGDKLIPSEIFCKIGSIQDIENTKPNSILVFKFDKNILAYCLNNHILTAPIIDNITQSVIANAMNAKYQICNKSISRQLQNLAENYIYDSKILAIISDEKEIEELAMQGIDGVIYNSYIL